MIGGRGGRVVQQMRTFDSVDGGELNQITTTTV